MATVPQGASLERYMKTLILLLALLAQLAHADAYQDRRAAEIADARAMVYEGWAGARYQIKRIGIGYRCSVISEDDMKMALLAIRTQMYESLSRSFEGGFPLKLSPKESFEEAIDAAGVAVDNGACAAMTPGDRGRLREFITMLYRSM